MPADRYRVLVDRATWYAEGCPFLEDTEDYLRHDLALDAAADLVEALLHVRRAE